MDGVSLVRSNRTVRLYFKIRTTRCRREASTLPWNALGTVFRLRELVQNYAPYIKQRLNRQNWEWKLDGTAEAPYLYQFTGSGIHHL